MTELVLVFGTLTICLLVSICIAGLMTYAGNRRVS